MTKFTIIVAITALSACSAERAPEPAAKPAPAVAGAPSTASPRQTSATTPSADQNAEGHAKADVRPGSHEDWCDEHRVPESQCTKCNPDLVAAYKATGDWCEEHGVPESHCLKCNPDLKIVRPPQGQ